VPQSGSFIEGDSTLGLYTCRLSPWSRTDGVAYSFPTLSSIRTHVDRLIIERGPFDSDASVDAAILACRPDVAFVVSALPCAETRSVPEGYRLAATYDLEADEYGSPVAVTARVLIFLRDGLVVSGDPFPPPTHGPRAGSVSAIGLSLPARRILDGVGHPVDSQHSDVVSIVRRASTGDGPLPWCPGFPGSLEGWPLKIAGVLGVLCEELPPSPDLPGRYSVLSLAHVAELLGVSGRGGPRATFEDMRSTLPVELCAVIVHAIRTAVVRPLSSSSADPRAGGTRR
jgi:hypothetical protein